MNTSYYELLPTILYGNIRGDFEIFDEFSSCILDSLVKALKKIFFLIVWGLYYQEYLIFRKRLFLLSNIIWKGLN